jgi:hypothetical protein
MQQGFANAGTKFVFGHVAAGSAYGIFYLVDRIGGASRHRGETPIQH